MKLICGPESLRMKVPPGALRVVLYGQAFNGSASAGAAAASDIRRRRLSPTARAWDVLSIALSVTTADFALQRDPSPDGWTRDFELDIAVTDAAFWNQHVDLVADALAFLTTDRWSLHFRPDGGKPPEPKKPAMLTDDCVMLLSGGVDSLVGAIDLVSAGRRPFAISQVVRGDAEKQSNFAAAIGGGLNHLQLNHNAHAPGVDERSQRARSLIFIAFGVVGATCLQRYRAGELTPLYVCENGLIALNPALTGVRLGSLSTRTAHPEFLRRLQRVLDAAEIGVQLENPYQTTTKGEMLAACADPAVLARFAVNATSCGRFLHYNYTHCGRCVPCQVRRAAFMRSGVADTTEYVFEHLGKKDSNHAAFDDVRAVAMALAEIEEQGIGAWIGSRLSLSDFANAADLEALVGRGLAELGLLHAKYSVQ